MQGVELFSISGGRHTHCSNTELAIPLEYVRGLSLCIIHLEKYSVKISFSLQLASQIAQSLSSPFIQAHVSQAPLSFYYYFLMYFQDYRAEFFFFNAKLLFLL